MLGKSYHSQVYTQPNIQLDWHHMLRFAITDRRLGSRPGESAAERNRRVAERAAELAGDGVEHLLIREKDLSAAELVDLSRAVTAAARAVNAGMNVLIAGRADVALAVQANGVHLSAAAGELTPAQVRLLMPQAFVSSSCHRFAEVERAREGGASAILFAPVFGKTVGGRELIAGVGARCAKACLCARGGRAGVCAGWRDGSECRGMHRGGRGRSRGDPDVLQRRSGVAIAQLLLV